jgi:CheY-like chemotaxis protein
MVIDDDPIVLDLLRELLTSEGFTVTCLEDAHTAHASIRTLHPDLLILDLRFGTELTGLTLIEALRRDPATQALPLVVCSADSQALREHGPALQKHNIPVIDKPFDLNDLLTVVKQQWSRAD